MTPPIIIEIAEQAFQKHLVPKPHTAAKVWGLGFSRMEAASVRPTRLVSCGIVTEEPRLGPGAGWGVGAGTGNGLGPAGSVTAIGLASGGCVTEELQPGTVSTASRSRIVGRVAGAGSGVGGGGWGRKRVQGGALSRRRCRQP